MAVRWWRYVSTGVGLSAETSHQDTSHQGTSPPDPVSSTNKPETNTSHQDPASSPNKLDIITPLNNEPVNPSVRIPRRMAVSSGKCLMKFCSCPHGRFVYDTGVGDPICIENDNKGGCCHKLSEHSESISEGNTPMLLSAPSMQSPVLSSTEATRYLGPNITERQRTVKGLFELLRVQRVVQIRATPMSGKTVLAELLRAYIIKNHSEYRVIYLSWDLDEGPLGFSQTINPSWLTYLSRKAGVPISKLINCSDIIFIIDEAQESYNCRSFWIDCIKPQADNDGGLHFALFSSFGSAGNIAMTFPGSAPIVLRQHQRISLSPQPQTGHSLCLCLTDEEYRDVANRICSDVRNPCRLSDDLIEHIYYLTNGHAGLTVAVIKGLVSSKVTRPAIKAKQVISLQIGREFLDDDSQLIDSCVEPRVQRSLPWRHALQDNLNATEALKQAVICNGLVADRLDEIPGLEFVYKMGWLQAEILENDQTLYAFPTVLHQRYCERLLYPRSGDDMPFKFSSLSDLCFAALRQFSPACLRGQPDKAAHNPCRHHQLPEAQFADELFRCLHLVTRGTGKGYVRSEFSHTRSGRIDFYLPAMQWGIECFRDGDRLEEHCNRFEVDGKYGKWDTIKEYILLDFRNERHPVKKRNIHGLYHVVFTNDFCECAVLDSMLRIVPGGKFGLIHT